MANEQAAIQATAIGDEAHVAVQERVTKLVQLLEEDRLGYRLERFVAQERETLAKSLSIELFDLRPYQSLLQLPALLERILKYDEVLLPYAEFFAVGSVYSDLKNAPVWTDLLERTATRDTGAPNSSHTALTQMALYPALLLFYAAGIMAASRNQWAVFRALCEHHFVVDYREPIPFISRINSFAIVPEQVQRGIPGKEKRRTPLIDHIYEILQPVLLKYFLTEARYSDTFARFEVISGALFAYADEQKASASSEKSSPPFRLPAGRYWSRDLYEGALITLVAQEAAIAGNDWSPVVAGLFSGDSKKFVSIAQKAKEYVAKNSTWFI